MTSYNQGYPHTPHSITFIWRYNYSVLHSLLYNKGEVCSKAKDLLLDLIANPKSKEEQECDLIELTFVYAKFGDIQGAINCLDRILAENPGHAEALRCKTFYLHYHDVIDIEVDDERSGRVLRVEFISAKGSQG